MIISTKGRKSIFPLTMTEAKIITIGLCPCWDTTCSLEGIDWGGHETVISRSDKPAGKAFNISRSLCWMGQKNVAAGLWGREDYHQMLKAVKPLSKLLKIKMTCVNGQSRQNITVIDTAKKREMHLRSRSELATKPAIKKLKADLSRIVNSNTVCVFAGAMGQAELLEDIIYVINSCYAKRARIVVDTSGEALRRIVEGANGLWLIKPNVAELGELVGRGIKDEPISLVKAGQRLLEKCETVLISRGRKGAVAVTKNGSWSGRMAGVERKVLSTVGCGDYFLAGYLKGAEEKKGVGFALKTALKAGTAKAWSWPDTKTWSSVQRQIGLKTEMI